MAYDGVIEESPLLVSAPGSISVAPEAMDAPYRSGTGVASVDGAALLAARLVWSSFLRSRLLIWAVGCLAVTVLGTVHEIVTRFDPTGISTSFGSVGNVLAAPAVRGDAIWYERIAHAGYYTVAATRFFPLYPLLVHVGSWLTVSPTIAGVLISLIALLVALALIHRLAVLELGDRVANMTVELVAFGPLALFLSAVYTESLFLALSVGTF
jgi:hypothetical protein